MLIERLEVKGLLSFGPKGIDLELEPLNVLIGPNGSGKSNLLAALELLRATTGDLDAYFGETGGAEEWFWKSSLHRSNWVPESFVSASTRLPRDKGTLEHSMSIIPAGSFGLITEESVVRRNKATRERGVSIYDSGTPSTDGDIDSQSVMSQMGRMRNNCELTWLRRQYSGIRLYRNWTFGVSTPTRQGQSAELSGDALAESADNLANVIAGFPASRREQVTYYLRRFYDRVVGISTPVRDSKVSLVIEEIHGGEMPASRLSDGTLRYLSLLATLLDPDPPPLIGIEEPELGLHPDIIPDIARLMIEASERTQLVVATHSPVFVDELTERPSSIIACEHYDGETHCHRVNPESLKAWQGERGLGEVWSMGGIGGNRW